MGWNIKKARGIKKAQNSGTDNHWLRNSPWNIYAQKTITCNADGNLVSEESPAFFDRL